MTSSRSRQCLLALSFAFLTCLPAVAQQQESKAPTHPWSNASLSPDERAGMVLKELTLDEKINFLHGQNDCYEKGFVGLVPGVPRLGIPPIQMDDAAYGARNAPLNGYYSTALPSNLGAAATWSTGAACDYGALIGRELRAQGYNMSLAGGVNLAREPRNGRTFEYSGEDPVLTGVMVGTRIRCEQEQHVIADIKHYAINDQETGRQQVDSIIGKRAMQESDLLAFQIGLVYGKPGGVMCSYNAVNGDYACENKYLLTDVLKKDWKFKGFVLSDWGGTHSTVKASAAGLDNEEPGDRFFGAKLKEAVQAGKVPMAEIDDHVRRVLYAEFASGIVDFPVHKYTPDVEKGFEIARRIAGESIVLLKNDRAILPLDRGAVHSIAIIGSHADSGVISGGGSAQVAAAGQTTWDWHQHVWLPSSPLKAVKAQAPGASVAFDSGENPAAAAALAGKSDVAIVYVNQWTAEGMDLPNLSLPDHQDALIEQVAAANPRTIVVLETGTAVTMPWLDKVSAVLAAWYPGIKGGEAIADVLFGDVNPGAKLPLTFPRSEADLPRPTIFQPAPELLTEAAVMRTGEAKPTFSVRYDEGARVGYKWYDSEKKPVLFPFGFGLSYTTFSYSDLKLVPEAHVMVTFTVKNTGSRAGDEVTEVYASLPASAGDAPKRFVGWRKIHLNPGESKVVTLPIRLLFVSIYDEAANGWKLVPGSYSFMVGGSSLSLPLVGKVDLK